MIVRWPLTVCAALTVAGCGQPAAVSAMDEGWERTELLTKMASHPSLSEGETRKGPDSALLPPPRFPDLQAHQHHGHHAPHSK